MNIRACGAAAVGSAATEKEVDCRQSSRHRSGAHRRRYPLEIAVEEVRLASAASPLNVYTLRH